MVKANNNIESVHQNLLQNKPLGDTSNHDPKGLQENGDKIASLIESMKKISISVNAKELGLEIDSRADDKSHENNSNYTMTEDDIKSVINEAMVKDNISRAGTVNVDPFQELRKSILISLSQLLKIVKPEVRQEIINAIANPNISQRNRIPCEAKRKYKVTNMTILNDTASESSSDSGSESDSSSRAESDSKNGLSKTEIMEIINAVKVEKK
ncbi:hypothetical protein Glove_158g16 [Diversispora epigaea]|uniref:Uncharacterized protein n=1 Tax=Diversispora epigaea TaxID=1348612 RepID=A0A397J049_9GLOM|nr:hypothetical protein Glove_158g16 [Diversispora epigaea]